MPRNRLQELREESGLSKRQVAFGIGVNPSTVGRWERGMRIDDDRKQLLAEFFDVTVAYLMGWDKPNGNGGGGERKAA